MTRLGPLRVLLIWLALSPPAWARPPADSPEPVPSTSATDALGLLPTRQARVPSEPSTTPSIGRHWYGWQILSADALSLSLLVSGAGTSPSPSGPADAASPPSSSARAPTLLVMGATGYVLAPPIIHLAHGRIGAAAGSLALRLALPEAGLLLGRSLDTCPSPNFDEHSECGIAGPIIGIVAGVIAASLIDAVAFSWAKDEPEQAPEPHFGWSPVLSSDGKRGELRLFGSF